MSRAEDYFLGQIAELLEEDEKVEASGYFYGVKRPAPKEGTARAAVKDEMLDAIPGVEHINLFLKASRQRGFFVALTTHKLIVVETRAGSFGRVLRENKSVVAVPRDEVTDFSSDGVGIVLGIEVRRAH